MLKSWNGQSFRELKRYYEQGLVDMAMCIEALSTGDLSMVRGAVWLIKYQLELKESLTLDETNQFLRVMDNYDEWELHLNILQSLKYLELEESCFLELSEKIIFALESDNKFLRAWGYEGLYQLAALDEEYEAVLMEKLNEGFQKETGAVLARIRKVIEKREKDVKRASRR